MAARVRTFRELQKRIEALPPPKPGLMRVFRGQDQNYPSLLPSSRRRNIARAQQEWESQANAVTTELRKLAALAERIIPPDYTLDDPQKTLDVAYKLADLSERYGDPAPAFARRRAIIARTNPGV